jgi:hypothetical protein
MQSGIASACTAASISLQTLQSMQTETESTFVLPENHWLPSNT